MLQSKLPISLVAVVLLAACSSEDTAAGDPNMTGNEAMGEPDAAPVDDEEGPLPTIPSPVEPCPTLATGNITLMGQEVQLWVGERQEDQKGPVLFYWHGTGSVSAEAAVFMQTQIDEVVAKGGVVASFTTSTGTGDYTGPFVWYSDDFLMADTILACAVEQLNIDTRRIFAAGCSAGGLQTSQMVYRRSSYLAAAMPNSGGIGEAAAFPSYVPAVITTSGAEGTDVVVLDFAITSRNFVADIASKGGFAVNCNHGGRHCGVPPEVVAAQWKFVNDHPYGTTADPYASGLPADFPSYCEVAR